MRLLVSVRSAAEVAAALAGGADIIDAKEPSRGGLGAVDPEDLEAIADGSRWRSAQRRARRSHGPGNRSAGRSAGSLCGDPAGSCF